MMTRSRPKSWNTVRMTLGWKVYAIANQLHFDLGMVEGGAYHTRFRWVNGQHSVEQVGSLPCACRIGG